MLHSKVTRSRCLFQQSPARISIPVPSHVVDPGDGIELWLHRSLFTLSPLPFRVLGEQLVHDGTPYALLCKDDASFAVGDTPSHDFVSEHVAVSGKVVLNEGRLRVCGRRVWRLAEEERSERGEICVGGREGEGLLQVRCYA